MIDDGLISFGTADGGIHVASNTVDEKLQRAAITRSGGELIDINDLNR